MESSIRNQNSEKHSWEHPSGGAEALPSPEEVENLRKSKRKLRNEDGVETSQAPKKVAEANEDVNGATQPRRLYVSMVKGSDFVYELSLHYKDDTDSSDSEVDSDYESDFEYSDVEAETKGSVNWKARRMISIRRVIKDEDGYPNLTMNRAEKLSLKKHWKKTLIVKLLSRRIGFAVLHKRLNSTWEKE
ncbi:hypothetical protein PIB30_024496 [Stylosanthes scabra]|uniref:Uncharacterized protein n=1 Tax=Stylosanthes scabra TaxID=79078 RepID=A0ABU6Z6H5_9FABA|nr:hypothetical protein [Stylosanthes scabra]